MDRPESNARETLQAKTEGEKREKAMNSSKYEEGRSVTASSSSPAPQSSPAGTPTPDHNGSPEAKCSGSQTTTSTEEDIKLAEEKERLDILRQVSELEERCRAMEVENEKLELENGAPPQLGIQTNLDKEESALMEELDELIQQVKETSEYLHVGKDVNWKKLQKLKAIFGNPTVQKLTQLSLTMIEFMEATEHWVPK